MIDEGRLQNEHPQIKIKIMTSIKKSKLLKKDTLED